MTPQVSPSTGAGRADARGVLAVGPDLDRVMIAADFGDGTSTIGSAGRARRPRGLSRVRKTRLGAEGEIANFCNDMLGLTAAAEQRVLAEGPPPCGLPACP